MATAAGQWQIAVGEGVRVIAPDGGDATPRAKKARALVAYLAAMPGRTATRNTLVALLWSNRANEQARASLRQCLFELRSGSPGLIDADGETVTLNAVVAIVGNGPLLPLDRIDPAFDHWLAARRSDSKAGIEAPPSARASPRRGWPFAVAGLTLVGALAAWLALPPVTPHAPIVLLRPLIGATDAATRAAATRFPDAARTMLAATRVRLAPNANVSGVDWIVGGTIVGNAMVARLTTPQRELLWSARAAVGPDGVVAAADRLGYRAARMMTCAAGGPPARRDAGVSALLMSFCDSLDAGGFQHDDEATLALARRLAAAAPRDAYAHGHLAATLAINSGFAPPPLASPMRMEAAREATLALALDARTGEAWLARAVLSAERRDFAQQEAALRSGLAAESDNPHLPSHLGSLLTSVGRLEEAVIEEQRGLALDPASPAKRAAVAERLLRLGNPTAAFALLNDPGVYDPGHIIARRRALLEMWSGDTAAARAAIAAAGDAFEPIFAARLISQTRAIDNPRGPEAAALLAQPAAMRAMSDRADYRLVALANLGRTDEALNVALRTPVQTEVFFRPNTRALLLSPRFPQVARFQGLWSYWQSTGHWPDICADADLGWRCPVKNPLTPH